MKPDHHRIHELEYDLGFRDDPPAPRITDEPGAVISYNPEQRRPQSLASCDTLMKQLYVQ